MGFTEKTELQSCWVHDHVTRQALNFCAMVTRYGRVMPFNPTVVRRC